jgi:hypothetical protein
MSLFPDKQPLQKVLLRATSSGSGTAAPRTPVEAARAAIKRIRAVFIFLRMLGEREREERNWEK